MKEVYNLWLILLPEKNVEVIEQLFASSFNPLKDAIVVCESKPAGCLSNVLRLFATNLDWPVKNVKNGDPVCSKGLFQLEEDLDFSADNMMMISTTVFPDQSPHIIVEGNQVRFQMKKALGTEEKIPSWFSADEMSQIACALSHDVRAPVRHITQFAKLAKELVEEVDEIPEEVLDYINIIASSSLSLNEQIEALVKYIRLNLQTPELIATDLSLCLATAKLRRMDANAKDDVNVKLNCVEPVWSDPDLLGEVFYQLMDNSIKFSKDKARLEVLISGKKDAENIDIVYQDNSFGFSYFPSDTYSSIFQKLHSNENIPGAGVGLSVCRKIIHSLKGEFVIDSSSEFGVKILIRLPAVPAA